jgi:flagellar motor switch protein FliN/FliY
MMMSDGALSQAEIDALLAGVDSGGGGAATAVAGGGLSDAEQKALEGFFSSTIDAHSSNLSKMTGSELHLSSPHLTVNGRDAFLEQLPETVTVVKVDFNSGFPGEHMFIIPEDGAKAIAALMNKEENIQLDEMAMSVLGEVVSQMVGYQITALSDKTGNKSIASVPPDATNIPKAVVALPAGDFIGVAYQLDTGAGKSFPIWEVMGPSVASDIAKALTGGGHPKAAAGNAMGMGGMGMSGGMQGMGGMGAGAFGPTNVQSVQFPNLMPHGGPQESGNISLIMDVFMEMTVELGRTRKLIKEILAMGEGTIIELDKLAGEPVDILVNHKLIAKGEVVVIDENFGVRVTEIVSPMERMSNMD